MLELLISIAVGLVLIVLGLAMIRWHFVVWAKHRDDPAATDQDKWHYRCQFRRRLQVSVLLVLLGVLIPGGDIFFVNFPQRVFAFAIYWTIVLILTAWMMLLGAIDWLSGQAHARAARGALARLHRQERALLEEAERLRHKGSNGRGEEGMGKRE